MKTSSLSRSSFLLNVFSLASWTSPCIQASVSDSCWELMIDWEVASSGNKPLVLLGNPVRDGPYAHTCPSYNSAELSWM